MLDWQLYERKAGGHHMTNLLLHTAGVLLLFLVLAQMSGALWRSAFVAAIFAIHPLPVESQRLPRSEEHTSELQSRGHLVCCLLLEKKKISLHVCLRDNPTDNPLSSSYL